VLTGVSNHTLGCHHVLLDSTGYFCPNCTRLCLRRQNARFTAVVEDAFSIPWSRMEVKQPEITKALGLLQRVLEKASLQMRRSLDARGAKGQALERRVERGL
jgi:hypothetical protein